MPLAAARMDQAELDAIDRRLLDAFQRDFPLTPRPYAAIGERLGLEEADVVARLARLSALGVIGRVGAVVAPGAAGASTLAAMAVPEDRIEAVAALVNAHGGVNHNYEREHALNLWFVVTAPDRARIDATLAAIAAESGLEVLDLPLIEAYRIDLGFPLQWA